MSITAPLLSYASVTTPADRNAPARHIPELPLESRSRRYGYALLAVLLAALFGLCTVGYWIDLHTGVDQNGYLVGGKRFAETLSMKQAPTQLGHPDRFDPHYFIANMWVSAASNPQHFYPKYPLGLPLIYAICLWVGGSSWGPTLAHMVSPASMTLAVLGVFFLVRQFAGSFPAILAMLVFATSPLNAYLANNPNSHASTVFCVVWGMLCVLHWWRVGGRRWALVGGFLVGYAATIRYTEGALVLPLLWAAGLVLLSGRRSWRGWTESVLLLVAWAAPIVVLLSYNWIEMGTLTGYDATNESTGFALVFLFDNWEIILRQLSLNGLFLVLPVAVAGLITMFWWNWRLAVFVWLWVGPCLTIYTCYYWAPDGVGYLRFIATILPPMLVGAFWLLAHVRDLMPVDPPRVAAYLMILATTAAGLGAGMAAFYGPRIQIGAEESVAAPAALPAADSSSAQPTDGEPWARLLSVGDYLEPQAETSYARAGLRTIFYASVVMCAAWGAIIGACFFLGRSVVPTLAGGVVAFLCIAVQSNNSTIAFERDSYDRRNVAANVRMIQDLVPDHSVLIFREEGYLHHLQFVRDYITYTGLTFDKRWVEQRPQAPTDDAVLMDPVRGRQLIDALKPYDQAALNGQARDMVKNALAANRRVFVVESARLDDLLKARKEQKDGPVPEFVRRFILPGKDKSLEARRVAYWNTQIPVKDVVKVTHRGRRDGRPNWRATCYQAWEITSPRG